MKMRLSYICVAFCICFTYVFSRLAGISTNKTYKAISDLQNVSSIDETRVYANIYDRSFNKLVNTYSTTDYELINGKSIRVTKPQRYSEKQLASHAIGYIKDGKGVSGIEMDYDSFLRSYYSETAVSINNSVDALTYSNIPEGVVTTLDVKIQTIAEQTADKYIKSGAAIIMDIRNGDILASVSRPNYSQLDLLSAINDDINTPLINRVNQPYNLGSIFKLVIAATGIEEGYSLNTMYNCKGYVVVEGQKIKCHKESGHGLIDMTDAMNDSCNCYFINMGTQLNKSKLIWSASSLGFGRIIRYANNLCSRGGYLQTESDLTNLIEKSNFSFGQGKLTATPVQVTEMTCAFANGGMMPTASIIKGITLDGKIIHKENESFYTSSLRKETADTIKNLMISVVEYEGNELAKPKYVTAGGKTATAQTGCYNDDGTEKLNCWFTGFFPAESPIYAITVLSENGKSALSECGAAFAKMCDRIFTETIT